MTDQFDPATVDLRLHATWHVRHKASDEWRKLNLGDEVMLDRDADERALAELGDEWELRYIRHEAVQALPWGAPSPEDRDRLLLDMQRRLADAGVDTSVVGADAIMGYPTGWLRIAEVMTHFMCKWAAEGEEIRFYQLKEKYGTLRCYTYGNASLGHTDGSARLNDLTEWCMSQSRIRCMATGQRGAYRDTGWIYTLSDEMFELHLRDKEAVRQLMYPSRPT